MKDIVWNTPSETNLPPRAAAPFDAWSIPVLIAGIDKRTGLEKQEVGCVRYVARIDGHGRVGTRVGDPVGYGSETTVLGWALLPEFPAHLKK